MTLIFLVIFVALIFTYINGFHDTANSIATVVATKVLSPRQAVMLAAVTNLTGAFLITQALLRAMLKNRWGRIINISSVVGRTGQAGQVNYAATKAGLIGMTRSLAREVAARGITVNAVAPGYIETPMTAVLTPDQTTAMLATIPLGRAGTDADIANAVLYLASEGAGYVTGAVLDVNGGMFMGG